MRKKYFGKAAIIGISAMSIIVLMLLLVQGSSAADPTLPLPYVGIRSETEICRMLDGADPPNEIDIPRAEAKIEGENGTNGTILLKCSTVDSNEIQGQEKWNFENTGRLCEVASTDESGDTFGSSTDDWNGIVSASGNIKLTCHFGDQFE